jgi:hypothetical protein
MDIYWVTSLDGLFFVVDREFKKTVVSKPIYSS